MVRELPHRWFPSMHSYRTISQAYDIEGKELPQGIYRPMFIDKSEFAEYDRIMTKISSRYFNGKL